MVAPSCPSPGRLQQLLLEDVERPEQEALLAHLEVCSTCRHRLDELAGANTDILARARALVPDPFSRDSTLRLVLANLSQDERLITLYRSGYTRDPRIPPFPPVDLLKDLQDYQVSEILGQGGMGLVYKAFQPALRRWVAIKVLAPHMASDDVARRRFAQEAQAAAAVRHENVITIHTVGETGGLPYFVMEYIAGGSLQDYLDRHPTPDWQTVARLGAEIASGLAAAHARGLIHRDIKPSNILLHTDRSAQEPGVAKISDFGLARIADGSRLTQTGVITGTPLYMAPEQVLGGTISSSADLFSLGTVLYTLATGVEPFCGGSAMAVLRQVCDVTPPSIQTLNPSIPLWMARIIERLHAKAPADRFVSAADVAEVLSQGLEDPDHPPEVPCLTPPASSRACWKHRVLPVLALLLLCSLLLAGVLARYQGRDRATRQDGPKASLHLRAALEGHGAPVWSVAFSPDGKKLATGSDDTTLRIWNPVLAREIVSLPSDGSAVYAVLFAHSSHFLLTSYGNGTIRLWDLATRSNRLAVKHGSSNARRIALSPDDRTVAIPNNRQGVDLWDLETGHVEQSLPGEQGTVQSLAFSVDGKMLATGDARGRIRLWSPGTGAEQVDFPADPLGVRSLAFSPDNRVLASAGSGGREVKLWQLSSRQPLLTLAEHDGTPTCIAFSPDGQLLVAGNREGVVRVWDTAAGEQRAVSEAHQGAIWALAISPDGAVLATAGEDRRVCLWDMPGTR